MISLLTRLHAYICMLEILRAHLLIYLRSLGAVSLLSIVSYTVYHFRLKLNLSWTVWNMFIVSLVKNDVNMEVWMWDNLLLVGKLTLLPIKIAVKQLLNVSY